VTNAQVRHGRRDRESCRELSVYQCAVNEVIQGCAVDRDPQVVPLVHRVRVQRAETQYRGGTKQKQLDVTSSEGQSHVQDCCSHTPTRTRIFVTSVDIPVVCKLIFTCARVTPVLPGSGSGIQI